MATVAAETWTGANGAAWPAQWYSTDATRTVIQDNRGNVVSAAAWAPQVVAYMTGATATANTDLYLEFRLTDASVVAWHNFSIQAPSADNNSADAGASQYGYHLYVETGNNLAALYRSSVNGEYVSVSATVAIPGGLTANVDYGIRFRAVSGLVQARIWALSGAEPSTWLLEYTDATPLTNAGRLRFSYVPGGTGFTWQFDNLTITDGAPSVTLVTVRPSGTGTGGTGTWTTASASLHAATSDQSDATFISAAGA